MDNDSPFLRKLEKSLWDDYSKILLQEELVWFQKSRCRWLRWGDRNTSYFHATTIVRRRKNRINALMDENRCWVNDQNSLKLMASSFYDNLYREDCYNRPSLSSEYSFPPLSELQLNLIHRDVSDDEIKNAAFEIGAFKAPGPDGLHAGFIQQYWNQLKDSIHNLVRKVFSDPTNIRDINDTFITLVPKMETPETIRDFRPISLCNVSYKIITKILANRLKVVMNHIIGEEQCSFIQGRQSSDNIIIAQEIIHSMRSKQGKKGFMAIKLDIEKAFDRLSWDFIDQTLQKIGLNDHIRSIIMAAISTPKFRILWNGEPSSAIHPSRGIRQGDPLSPYIFILCMERLSHCIHDSISKKEWKPINLSTNGPPISHLFFADDLLLFADASLDQARVIEQVIRVFCSSSGQRINLSKSKLFCSKNVNINRALQISNVFNIPLTGNLGKYLGIPLLHQRASNLTFASISDKVSTRLSGWKGRHLSIAGRSVLVKSVLLALPNYAMQTMLLPLSLIDKVEKQSQNFLWNSTDDHQRQHLISWNQITKDKKDGGLGIRNLRSQNIAYLMKLCWGL